MKRLGGMGITSVLAEGGGGLIGGLAEERLVDKFLFFIAPKIIGGRAAVTSVEGKGTDRIDKALCLKNMEYKMIGKDLLVTCSPG
jgi:diaminohydroxyphosphoribosylaminopyrimidine deaminase/5-amino-6-(5-phosphoribosylamino)uracil reductase